MAPGSVANRFIAPVVKGASARLLLALALLAATLALAACGGSSDPAVSSSATSTRSNSALVTASGARESEQTKNFRDTGSPRQGTGDAPKASKHGGVAEGHKHGRYLKQPKGPPEHSPTPREVAQATVADISLTSPAIVPSGDGPGVLSAAYTCDGANSWPKLNWTGVPADTAELALYAMSVQPVEGKLFVDWALAGLNPRLEGIEAGELPKGAVVGTNGFGRPGYSICPFEGEIYMFALYALPQKLHLRQGFDAREARKEVLAVSGNVGLLPTAYARG